MDHEHDDSNEHHCRHDVPGKAMVIVLDLAMAPSSRFHFLSAVHLDRSNDRKAGISRTGLFRGSSAKETKRRPPRKFAMRKFSPSLDVLLVEASVKLGYQKGVLGSKLSSDEYMVRRSSLYTNG